MQWMFLSLSIVKGDYLRPLKEIITCRLYVRIKSANYGVTKLSNNQNLKNKFSLNDKMIEMGSLISNMIIKQLYTCTHDKPIKHCTIS